MKKFILLIILGCFSIFGFAVTPIDPPKKAGDTDKTVTDPITVSTTNPSEITLSSPNQNEECAELRSMVDVTVIVTLGDCPDYDCSLPGPTCTCEICVYDNSSCTGTSLGCSETWDPEVCTYRIPVQADEGYSLWASFSCHNCSYGNGCQISFNIVPSGGGDVYIYGLNACPY